MAGSTERPQSGTGHPKAVLVCCLEDPIIFPWQLLLLIPSALAQDVRPSAPSPVQGGRSPLERICGSPGSFLSKIIKVNVVDSPSLSIVVQIGALGLLPSGHLVQAMVRIHGLDGEFVEGRIKARVQGGTGPSRTAWRHFGETGGQHFCPPCPFPRVLW